MNSTILFKIGNNAKNGITVLKKPQRREKIGKNKKKEEMDVIDEGKLEKDKKQEEVTRSQDGEPRRSLVALKRAHKILEEADKQKKQELIGLKKERRRSKPGWRRPRSRRRKLISRSSSPRSSCPSSSSPSSLSPGSS